MTSTWTRISFQAPADMTPADSDFCLPNLLAGSVGIVAAQAGIGKTSLLLQLGAAVAAGIPVAHGALPAPARTGKVVFLAAEDPPAILRRRAHFLTRSLIAQGHGESTIERLERDLQVFSLNGDCPTLLSVGNLSERAVDRIAALANHARLLVLDPIRRFHLCDEQDYGQMALLFGVLADIAVRTGCTILFSHHLPPDTGDDSDGAHGSSAFVDASRWVLEMYPMSGREAQRHRVDDARRAEFVMVKLSKSNYGPRIEPFWLQRSGEFEGVFQHYMPDGAPAGSWGEVER